MVGKGYSLNFLLLWLPGLQPVGDGVKWDAGLDILQLTPSGLILSW